MKFDLEKLSVDAFSSKDFRTSQTQRRKAKFFIKNYIN